MNSRSIFKCILPPLCALVALGFMIIPRERQIHEITKQTTTLRERVAQAEKPGRPEGSRSQSLVEQMGATKRPDILAKIEQLVSDYDNPPAEADFDLPRDPSKMSVPELLAKMDELETANISEHERIQFRQKLAISLMDKAPDVAVQRLFQRSLDLRNHTAGIVAQSYAMWLKKDYDAAVAWFHERETAGDFESSALDGMNPLHLMMMAPLTHELFTRDPGAAEHLLASLPQDQRSAVMGSSPFLRASLDPTKLADYVGILRRQLTDKQSSDLLARYALVSSARGGYEGVDKFVSQIDPTPDDRKAIASELASAITRRKPTGEPVENFSDLNQWLSEFAPGEASMLTGQAVAKSHWLKPEQQVSAIEQLHARTGGDDLLLSFLKEASWSVFEQHGRRLADKITDPTKRATAMETAKHREKVNAAPMKLFLQSETIKSTETR